MCTEDSPSGLWRTLGKRVGCKPSGVRIPHPPPLTPEPSEVPGFLLLVVPQVFRAPSGPAAREIATREPYGSEWSISKPARALRALRRPPHQWCLVAVCDGVWRPAREPSAPRAFGSARPLEAQIGPAAPAISHAIPSDVFHGLKSDRWNSADSALRRGWAELELHAELWDGLSPP